MDAAILSAGKASRFGVPKFLLPAGGGQTLLTRAVETALRGVSGRVVVVLGREAGLAQCNLSEWLRRNPVLESRVEAVENPNFEQGQSTSLIAAARALQGSQGFVVLLADMPLIGEARLGRLVAEVHSTGRLIAVAAGERGEIRPPVYLSSNLFPEISQLTGDQGARAILERRRGEIEVLEWGSGDWFTDIDTWETYQQVALRQSWATEPFERLENPPTLQNLSQWFMEIRKHPDALALLRRGVLGLLNA